MAQCIVNMEIQNDAEYKPLCVLPLIPLDIHLYIQCVISDHLHSVKVNIFLFGVYIP